MAGGRLDTRNESRPLFWARLPELGRRKPLECGVPWLCGLARRRACRLPSAWRCARAWPTIPVLMKSGRDGGKGVPELWAFPRRTRRHPHRLRGTDKGLCIACALSVARALGEPVTELLE